MARVMFQISRLVDTRPYTDASRRLPLALRWQALLGPCGEIIRFATEG